MRESYKTVLHKHKKYGINQWNMIRLRHAKSFVFDKNPCRSLSCRLVQSTTENSHKGEKDTHMKKTVPEIWENSVQARLGRGGKRVKFYYIIITS